MFKPMSKRKYIVTAALIISALLTAIFGCEEKVAWQDPGAEETFERFLLDWYRGNREAAFESIAAEDRRELLEPYDKLEARLEADHLPDKSEMLVAGRVDNPYDLAKIELEEPLESAPAEGDRVTLLLHYHDGREGEATMLWGGERWYVDLPLAGEDSATEAPADADDAGAAEQGEAPKDDADSADDAGSIDDAGDAGDTSTNADEDAETDASNDEP